MFLIDDSTPDEVFFQPVVNGEPKGRGLVPRDFTIDPPEMFDPPSNIPLIPRSEWDARIEEQDRLQSSLEHIRGTIESLDQGNVGYCWAHSTAHCVTLIRARDNQPYVPLSAYAVAATIKQGRDEGGWCGLSAKFLRERGIPSQALWPQGDRDYRKYDRPEIWQDAARRKVTEEWIDLTRSVYDQNLTFDQVATCLLLNIPCALDFNHWSHSVCGLRLVRVEAGSYGIKIWNSWSDGWGERGMAVLRGQKAIPDGAVALRVSGMAA